MRIGWDQYETALLIEACEQVTQSKVSRVIAAQELSKSLRDRAQNNGIEIDELFRNENGMILQMAKMDYLLLNGEKGLPGAGKLFETMAQLRKANPEQYYEILRTAKMQIDGSKEENRKLPDNDMRILIKNSDTLLDYFTEIAGQFPELIFTNYDATSVQQRRAVYIYKKDCSRRGNVLFEIWMLSEASTFAYFIKREYLTAEENAEVERTDSRASATRGRINRKWNYVDEFLDFIKEKLALTRESGPSNEKADPMYKELQKTVEYLSQRYEVLLHYDRFTNPAHTVNDMMYKVKINEKDAMWVYYIHRNRNHYISIETEPEYLRNMVGGTTGFTEIRLRTSHPCQKMMFVNYDDIKESLEDICDSIDLSFNAPASRETEVKYSGQGIVTEHMFLNYCESVGMAPRSSGNYASSIRAAEKYAMEKGIAPWQIFNTEESESLQVIGVLLNDVGFLKMNEKRHNLLTSSFKKFSEMIGKKISIPTSFDLKKNTPDEPEEPDDYDKAKYTQTLLSRYRNGMTFDSIDMDIFRETYEMYNDEKIDCDDEELKKRLRGCGIAYNGRLFPAEGIIDNETKDRLFNYIDNSFAMGKKVLYYEAIYKELSNLFMRCYTLTDENMLRAFIEYTAEPEKYYFFKKYMSKDQTVTIDHNAEVEEYYLTAGKPVSTEEVCEALSHIPEEQVRQIIVLDNRFLRNTKGEYFHRDIFEISENEINKIADIVKGYIDENEFAVWTDVWNEIQEQMPIFLENNLYLSMLGVRNAVANYLNDRFSFDGSIISLPEDHYDMKAAFKLYAKHHKTFTADDTYNLAKELDTVIYFEALYEVSVRVSHDLFVSKDQIAFDVDAIDKAIESYMAKDYIRIREIDSFLAFPSVGYEWNEYLLESYAFSYSRKFMLLNNGFSLNNVAGAVAKRDGTIKEFVDACAAVLVDGQVELKKDIALNHLAEVNMITRRSYRDLEEAMQKAMQIRGRKD